MLTFQEPVSVCLFLVFLVLALRFLFSLLRLQEPFAGFGWFDF
jgi:hypothetical protein